jgi:hypothetical protein
MHMADVLASLALRSRRLFSGQVKMWCSNCQQDVPTVGETGTNRSLCSRCQRSLRPPHAAQICDEGVALDEPAAVAAVASGPPLLADDWQQRRRNRELGRKLRHEVGTRRARPDNRPGTQRRIDPPGDLFDELEQLTASPIIMPTGSVAARRNDRPRRADGGQFVAWLFALCGAATLGGGIGTIAWSLAGSRPDLWNLAVGLTLAGQGLLVFGLVMIVTRLWRNSRYAAAKLQEVHGDISQLQRTADALTAMRSGGAPAFYAELVRGASPQMLLANLKGQLEQLATRLGS